MRVCEGPGGIRVWCVCVRGVGDIGVWCVCEGPGLWCVWERPGDRGVVMY